MGNIKERLKTSVRKDWDIHAIEYSEVVDKDEMSKYESYHIEQYVKSNGRKPMYNMINGKSLDTSISHLL